MAASESGRSIIGRRYDLSRQIYNSRDDNAPKSNKDEPKVVFFWNISTSLPAICRVGFDVLIRMNAVASHFYTPPKRSNRRSKPP